jgi:carbonic anhydrase/acetyltransferase-like protein (isoleucine patch superfamily)
VLRATSAGGTDLPVVVGDHTFVGPHATLLGCVVEPACYVATGATVLQGATVESWAVVAVGALVHANANVPREFFVPPNTIAVGDSLQVYAPGDEGLPEAIKSANFARSAFGGAHGVGGPHPEVQGDRGGQGGGVREPPRRHRAGQRYQTLIQR